MSDKKENKGGIEFCETQESVSRAVDSDRSCRPISSESTEDSRVKSGTASALDGGQKDLTLEGCSIEAAQVDVLVRSSFNYANNSRYRVLAQGIWSVLSGHFAQGDRWTIHEKRLSLWLNVMFTVLIFGSLYLCYSLSIGDLTGRSVLGVVLYYSPVLMYLGLFISKYHAHKIVSEAMPYAEGKHKRDEVPLSLMWDLLDQLHDYKMTYIQTLLVTFVGVFLSVYLLGEVLAPSLFVGICLVVAAYANYKMEDQFQELARGFSYLGKAYDRLYRERFGQHAIEPLKVNESLSRVLTKGSTQEYIG